MIDDRHGYKEVGVVRLRMTASRTSLSGYLRATAFPRLWKVVRQASMKEAAKEGEIMHLLYVS